LAHGRKLLTLQDAATYITNLPKNESDLPEWQAAIEALMLVADHGGPTMFARIGVMRALADYANLPDHDVGIWLDIGEEAEHELAGF
jgi:hypothetical protein